MKKVLSLILSLCMALSVCGAAIVPAFAEDVDWSDKATWPADT